MYEYRDKEQTGIFQSGGTDLLHTYERNKKYHLMPGSVKYGAVLIRTKRVKVGFEVKVKLFYRDHWYWKPEFYWRYGMRYFYWLFFMIWLDGEYHDVPDGVVMDHLADYNGL